MLISTINYEYIANSTKNIVQRICNGVKLLEVRVTICHSV